MSKSSRDLLISNAEAFAAGKTLGLSEDFVLERLEALRSSDRIEAMLDQERYRSQNQESTRQYKDPQKKRLRIKNTAIEKANAMILDDLIAAAAQIRRDGRKETQFELTGAPTGRSLLRQAKKIAR